MNNLQIKLAISIGLINLPPDNVLKGIIESIDATVSTLDFSGVCNFLASTTGLPAAQALRNIES